nr:MAG TPA: hypothetical protein [Inoviridae sp.]
MYDGYFSCTLLLYWRSEYKIQGCACRCCFFF